MNLPANIEQFHIGLTPEHLDDLQNGRVLHAYAGGVEFGVVQGVDGSDANALDRGYRQSGSGWVVLVEQRRLQNLANRPDSVFHGILFNPDGELDGHLRIASAGQPGMPMEVTR